jgi:hypothetical protein
MRLCVVQCVATEASPKVLKTIINKSSGTLIRADASEGRDYA